MPEHYPFYGEPIESTCVTPEDGRPHEEWRCADCDKTRRRPGGTVLGWSLDFSEHGDQLDRRDVDTDLD